MRGSASTLFLRVPAKAGTRLTITGTTSGPKADQGPRFEPPPVTVSLRRAPCPRSGIAALRSDLAAAAAVRRGLGRGRRRPARLGAAGRRGPDLAGLGGAFAPVRRRSARAGRGRSGARRLPGRRAALGPVAAADAVLRVARRASARALRRPSPPVRGGRALGRPERPARAGEAGVPRVCAPARPRHTALARRLRLGSWATNASTPPRPTSLRDDSYSFSTTSMLAAWVRLFF